MEAVSRRRQVCIGRSDGHLIQLGEDLGQGRCDWGFGDGEFEHKACKIQFCNYTRGVDAIKFEWDEAKNLSNQQKHGLSFEEATEVFRDPLHVSVQDRIEIGEERWRTFGMVRGVLLVMGRSYFSRRGSGAYGDPSHLGTPRGSQGKAVL